jgi:NADP-dependent 3-hydroxy acid dehydrogenase YdfG
VLEEMSMAGTVLIVGASGDVGQGIARTAVAQGWTVIAAGRSADRLERQFGAERSGRLHL